MSETIAELRAKLLELQQENQDLRDSCDSLRQVQASYEEIFGENNANILRADMARMELEQIFSSYTDAMWVVREDGVVVRANDAMLKMLDKSVDEVIGQSCSSLLSYGLCDQDNCPLNSIKRKNTDNFDIQLKKNEKTDKHFLLTTAPLVTIDGTPGIVAQFKDITSRKEAEEALEEANQTLKKMARIDGLTQIANRRSFDEMLIKEWRRLRRNPKPLSLLLGDIDFFKKFNDHYGHLAGDDCLRMVAKTLADSLLRPADMAARYGGEEFALLLPEVDIEGALLVGNRAIESVHNLKIEHQDSEASDFVTISMGAATLTPSADHEPEDLVSMADDALYQAKKLGRNRVIPAATEESTAVHE
jgi:diguanylate cyclase (GGDEF)-like protein/PAS domain S-box-containing protein